MLLLLSVALKSTLALALGALVVRLLRNAPASLRHSIWAVTFAGLLALPLLDALGPVWTVGVLPGDVASGEILTIPLAPPTGLPLGAQGALPSGAPAPELGPFASGVSPGTWLVVLWALGALGVAMVWIRALALARRLVRDASDVDGTDWADQAARAAVRSGLARPVRLVQSGQLSVPIAWGFGRDAVVLPPQADTWDEERRESVLLHEMAHLRRRDAWTQVMAQAALALHWPNPLAWLAYRRFMEAREQACDDAVLQQGAAPTSYASHLVAVARELRPPHLPLAAVAQMVGRDELETRVLSILDDRRQRGQVSRWALGATLALAVAVGGPLAAFQPVPAAPSGGALTALGDQSGPSLAARVDASEPVAGQGVLAPDADGGSKTSAVTSSTSPEAPRPAVLRPSILHTDPTPRDTIDRRTPSAESSSRRDMQAAPDPAHDVVHAALDAEIQAEILAEMGAEVDATRFARRYAARYAEQYPARYRETVRQVARSGRVLDGVGDETRTAPTDSRTSPSREPSSRPFPNPDS